MLPITNNDKALTMSNIQIAELCNKRPDNVKRTMDSLSGKGLISITQFEERLKCTTRCDYYVNERDSYIVVAQLSPEFTAFLVDEWQRLKAKPLLTEDQQLLQLAQGVIKLTAERDEAIKTKAQINDKRTATLMNKASQDSKRIKKLESQVQSEGEYKSLIAAGLPQRVDTELKDNVQSFRILKNISADMELPPVKVNDPRYGSVNTYHVDVIAQFKEMYL